MRPTRGLRSKNSSTTQYTLRRRCLQVSEPWRWVAVFEGSDACFAPVLSPAAAPDHPHNRERGTSQQVHDALHPAPAPRFSRTPSAIQGPPSLPGAHTQQALVDWGLSLDELAGLRAEQAIA